MDNSYNTSEIANAYQSFLASEDGHIFRDVVGKAILFHVIPEFSPAVWRRKYPESRTEQSLDSGIPVSSTGQAPAGMTKSRRILDAGCGDGWLASLLSTQLTNTTDTSHNTGSVSGSSPNRRPDEAVLARQSLGDGGAKLGIGEDRRGIIENSPTSPSLSLERRGINTEIHACDAGQPLIAAAKQKYPNVQFAVCDLNKPLPYQENYFDIVTASMVLHDVEDELATLKNISAVLKPGGKLLAAIVNPYYGYPIGVWKRGLLGRLLLRKPLLKLARSYNLMMQKNRPSFEWRPGLGSHFTPLSHHISTTKEAGFALTSLDDISSATDSPTYNLTYQLHRFPIILLLEFTKQ